MLKGLEMKEKSTSHPHSSQQHCTAYGYCQPLNGNFNGNYIIHHIHDCGTKEIFVLCYGKDFVINLAT